MIKISEPFIEAMDGWQKLVAIAQMILPKLCGGVSLTFEYLGECWVFFLDPLRRTRNTDRRHPCPDRQLPHKEGRAARRTTGLAIVVCKKSSFLCNSVDVGCSAHHPVRVSTDIPGADVVTKDDNNVGLLLRAER